jgi:cytochrome c5
MSNWKSISRSLIFLAAIPCLSQQSQPSPAPTTKPTPHEAEANDGQRAWNQNCSRCHNAPQGFSPHISGTVVMHMRARANLSQKDEQNILRFLNP